MQFIVEIMVFIILNLSNSSFVHFSCGLLLLSCVFGTWSLSILKDVLSCIIKSFINSESLC